MSRRAISGGAENHQTSEVVILEQSRSPDKTCILKVGELREVSVLELAGLLFTELGCIRSKDQQGNAQLVEFHDTL